ncbi:MAG: hypothetical protein JW834_03245 [Candidatus Diapherotrites archaeon]|nr:hypothetical protein [Candidatus Diapherotrites archaeon]
MAGKKRGRTRGWVNQYSPRNYYPPTAFEGVEDRSPLHLDKLRAEGKFPPYPGELRGVIEKSLQKRQFPYGFLSSPENVARAVSAMIAREYQENGVLPSQIMVHHFRNYGLLSAITATFGSKEEALRQAGIAEEHITTKVPVVQTKDLMNALGLMEQATREQIIPQELKELHAKAYERYAAKERKAGNEPQPEQRVIRYGYLLGLVAEHTGIKYATLYQLFNPRYKRFGAKASDLQRRIMNLRAHWGLDWGDAANRIRALRERIYTDEQRDLTLDEVRSLRGITERQRHNAVQQLSIHEGLKLATEGELLGARLRMFFLSHGDKITEEVMQDLGFTHRQWLKAVEHLKKNNEVSVRDGRVIPNHESLFEQHLLSKLDHYNRRHRKPAYERKELQKLGLNADEVNALAKRAGMKLVQPITAPAETATQYLTAEQQELERVIDLTKKHLDEGYSFRGRLPFKRITHELGLTQKDVERLTWAATDEQRNTMNELRTIAGRGGNIWVAETAGAPAKPPEEPAKPIPGEDELVKNMRAYRAPQPGEGRRADKTVTPPAQRAAETEEERNPTVKEEGTEVRDALASMKRGVGDVLAKPQEERLTQSPAEPARITVTPATRPVKPAKPRARTGRTEASFDAFIRFFEERLEERNPWRDKESHSLLAKEFGIPEGEVKRIMEDASEEEKDWFLDLRGERNDIFKETALKTTQHVSRGKEPKGKKAKRGHEPSGYSTREVATEFGVIYAPPLPEEDLQAVREEMARKKFIAGRMTQSLARYAWRHPNLKRKNREERISAVARILNRGIQETIEFLASTDRTFRRYYGDERLYRRIERRYLERLAAGEIKLRPRLKAPEFGLKYARTDWLVPPATTERLRAARRQLEMKTTAKEPTPTEKSATQAKSIEEPETPARKQGEEPATKMRRRVGGRELRTPRRKSSIDRKIVDIARRVFSSDGYVGAHYTTPSNIPRLVIELSRLTAAKLREDPTSEQGIRDHLIEMFSRVKEGEPIVDWVLQKAKSGETEATKKAKPKAGPRKPLSGKVRTRQIARDVFEGKETKTVLQENLRAPQSRSVIIDELTRICARKLREGITEIELRQRLSDIVGDIADEYFVIDRVLYNAKQLLEWKPTERNRD